MAVVNEIFYTKTTPVGKGLYGCRIYRIDNDACVVEMRVPKILISDAFRDMFRTLDKLGYNSPMAHASRMRGKNFGTANGCKYKFYWGGYGNDI